MALANWVCFLPVLRGERTLLSIQLTGSKKFLGGFEIAIKSSNGIKGVNVVITSLQFLVLHIRNRRWLLAIERMFKLGLGCTN